MKTALRTVFKAVLLTGYLIGYSQVPNDDCSTATDITPVFETLQNGDWELCNFPDGSVSTGIAGFEYHFEGATVSTPNFISDDCWGTYGQTSPHLPDIWFKVALEGVNNGYHQGFSVLAWDSLEIAVYQGSCSSLIQVDCFTPAPYYYQDIMTIPDTADADTMYIQLRSNTPIPFESFCFTPIVGGPAYYNSTRPAIVWDGTSGTSSISSSAVRVYPNPTSDIIHVESEIDFKSISLYDLLGNEVIQVDNHEHETLHVSHLIPGTYIIRMVDTGMHHHFAILNKN